MSTQISGIEGTVRSCVGYDANKYYVKENIEIEKEEKKVEVEYTHYYDNGCPDSH